MSSERRPIWVQLSHYSSPGPWRPGSWTGSAAIRRVLGRNQPTNSRPSVHPTTVWRRWHWADYWAIKMMFHCRIHTELWKWFRYPRLQGTSKGTSSARPVLSRLQQSSVFLKYVEFNVILNWSQPSPLVRLCDIIQRCNSSYLISVTLWCWYIGVLLRSVTFPPGRSNWT